MPLASLLCAGACLSTEGYYRYQDGGAAGAGGTGTPGTAGTTGAAGSGAGEAGTSGTAGSSGGSAAGTAGTGTAGRGGTTGTAGSGATGTAGTSAAGRGGTTGGAGATGSGGSGAILFMDDFEGNTIWDFQGDATRAVVADGATNHVFQMSSMMSKQSIAAYAPTGATSDHSIEARVKVTAWNGSSSSYIAALCARLASGSSFYYLAIQSNDGKLKIKYNNGSNSSIGSSIDAGFALNTWITLKFSVVGNTLTAYANGAMVGQETDSTITSGTSIGLLVDNATAQFDDVVVRRP